MGSLWIEPQTKQQQGQAHSVLALLLAQNVALSASAVTQTDEDAERIIAEVLTALRAFVSD